MSIAARVKNKIKRYIPQRPYAKSYSQSGEDLIAAFIFGVLKMKTISYLDIGCHHPTYLSNTAYFYKHGSTGVCIEPDPTLFKRIKSKRSKDVCLNMGIGTDNRDKADFYIISIPTLNTFSKEEAERYVSYGNLKIDKVIQVPLISVNEVMQKYFHPCPDFVSIDVEGFEHEILASFDFKKYRPKVFCIETITYTEDKTEQKITSTIEFMKEKGYFVYADTYINTIFIDEIAWKKR